MQSGMMRASLIPARLIGCSGSTELTAQATTGTTTLIAMKARSRARGRRTNSIRSSSVASSPTASTSAPRLPEKISGRRAFTVSMALFR